MKTFMRFLILINFFQILYASSLGGIVWFDANSNGLKEENEKGIAKVIVHLYKENIDTGIIQETNSSGSYKFENLEANHNYQVKIDKPKSYPYFTLYNVAYNAYDEKDSDVNPYSGFSDTVFLKENEDFNTLFAGFVCKMCKKIDIEKSTNGEDADIGSGPIVVQGEKVLWEYNVTNISNVELVGIVVSDNKEGIINCPYDTLLPAQSMLCSKEGIAQLGKYENIATVTAIAPDGSSISDKDPSHYMGKSKTACLGNFYWYDENLNGIQDKNEAGIIGIGVALYDANKNLLSTTKTDANGEYYFCDLEEGDYFVKFELPKSYLFTPQDKGSDLKDSDANAYGWSHKVHLSAGSKDLTVDAGIYCSCEDYKVHTDRYEDFKFATSKESATILAVLFFLIGATFRKRI